MSQSNKKSIQTMPEYMIWVTIDHLGYQQWKIGRDWGDGQLRLTEQEYREKLKSLSERMFFVVQQTSRFGITPLDAKGEPTQAYWDWYKTWHKWKKSLSDDQWNKFVTLADKNEDVSDYLPKWYVWDREK